MRTLAIAAVVVTASLASIGSAPGVAESSACCQCLFDTSADDTDAEPRTNCLADADDELTECTTQASNARAGDDDGGIEVTDNRCGADACMKECRESVLAGAPIKTGDGLFVAA